MKAINRRRFLNRTLSSACLIGFGNLLSACGGGSSDAQATTSPTTPNPPTPTTPPTSPLPANAALLMPVEDSTHLFTYMGFATAAEGIWTPITSTSTNAGIVRIQQDLIDVAKAIGTFEPVNMYVLPGDLATAQALLATASVANPAIHAMYLARAAGVGGVNFISQANVFDDIWMRDSGCIFVKDTANSNTPYAISYNFNGWGNANTDGINAGVPAAGNKSKAGIFYQPFSKDALVASTMATANKTTLVSSSLILEGGAIEFDGVATAIITESSVLHVNRNQQLFDTSNGVANAKLLSTAKATVLAELNRTLGVKKIIWIPGTAIYPAGCGAGGAGGAATPEKETDITNGHTDFYAKFLAPGVVAYGIDSSNAMGERAITTANLQALTGQTDANGNALTLIPFTVPAQYGTSGTTQLNASQMTNFAAGYINFYACNGALLMPKFNDTTADQAAVNAIAPYLNGRTLIQVDILGIAAGGGGIHCVTRQVPA